MARRLSPESRNNRFLASLLPLKTTHSFNNMSEIVLTTFNARYHHAAFGLRYLLANMGELQSRTTMLEFGTSQHSVEVLDAILERNPRIVGIGVYIWNIEAATQLVAILKRVRPDITVILGGPEVSYETENQPIVELADFVISGEADIAFRELCENILNGTPPGEKIIAANPPKLTELQLPYEFYSDEDIANRVIYVEASRGCPFTCEFCLSALDIPVRQFPLDRFLESMQSLLDRGTTSFKFVDRTFNLNIRVSTEILQFFLDRLTPDIFLHFEMIPDRLPDELRTLIKKFPAGYLQFEVGIQTFNENAFELISRRQNNELAERNLQFLHEETGVHVHADLIVGLPGENIESFAIGFDRLVGLKPQEIQVGMLKRLRGTPIVRHDEEWDMRYNTHAPYEILQNRLISFEDMSRLRRFSRYWDLVANSGNFRRSLPLIWKNGSPFERFSHFSNWLFAREGRGHGIPLTRLTEHVFHFLTFECQVEEPLAAESLLSDYHSGGRRDIPRVLRKHFDAAQSKPVQTSSAPIRQSRHLDADS